jgi:uridine kinase
LFRYDRQGQLVEPFIIGICGGSASGKTTVANTIIKKLGVPWVTLLSMDSFYKVSVSMIALKICTILWL